MNSLKNLLLFLLASLSLAQYAQLSSTKNQIVGPLGTGVALTYDSIDALQGITFAIGTSTLEVQSNGTYFVIAAPQVGCSGCGFLTRSFTADFWVAVNSVAVANSNVRLSGGRNTKDVIVTQGLVILNRGDKISILGAGSNAVCEAITQSGEPLIPSIILTVYKV